MNELRWKVKTQLLWEGNGKVPLCPLGIAATYAVKFGNPSKAAKILFPLVCREAAEPISMLLTGSLP